MPFTRKEYALLRGGYKGVTEWNILRSNSDRRGERPELARADLRGMDLSWANLSWANLSGANLSRANLYKANLSGADLSTIPPSDFTFGEGLEKKADLSGACLRDVNLSGVNLSEVILARVDLRGANLSGADLRRAWLKGANLSGENLNGVDLSGANLSGADLSGVWLHLADLSGANLSGADLRGANLLRVNLSGADLSGTNLTSALLREAILSTAILNHALLKWTGLADAIVEDVAIGGTVIYEIEGLPRPPSRLRLKKNGEEIILTGDEAANFFVLPAVVEVYLTQSLTDVELGCLHFHFGEVHANKASRDVYLIGHRREHNGSVLRFQGPTYEAVYAALPDLLAPFRTTAAIDWKTTLDSIPKDAQPGALVALAEAALQDRRQRWPIAAKLAQVFKVFANAEVRELKEGRSQGMVIKVATSKAMLQRLDPPTKGSMTLMVGENNRLAMLDNGEVIEMGDNTTVNAAGAIVGSAIGTNARVSAGGNITAEISQTTSPALAELAGAVKQALALLADTRLTKTEREQAEKHVEDIQAEAKKTPNPEGAGKIRGWLDSLTKLCKPAADLIAGVKAVAVALGLGG